MSNFPVLDEQAAREEICQVGRRLYDLFLVAANDGNISVRVNENEIVMTPTNISKGFMTPDDLVKLDLDGNLISNNGVHKASSERRMHLAVYREREDVRAVVHAHPPTATGFAVANVSLDQPFLPEVVVRAGVAPVVPYAIPGGEELPNSIVPYVKDHNSLLLGNHGAVAYGPTLRDALFNMETLELNARIFLVAHQLGHIEYLNEAQVEALRERYGC
ncbi:MAG TPA: class II aldolase/adducin family protein [Aggregatilinea sp.]|uniref:class II aldolase/adducin family protein n=1 Tax=Aggregatilinea sp. TaxID=2806333 RepID=UPI002CE98754|nr:class II aldolase/adducin family protein [Aggregatilinea sp.]HML21905.1 class II aldolase/adducin family protein [Aggregatilinea sp.]